MSDHDQAETRQIVAALSSGQSTQDSIQSAQAEIDPLLLEQLSAAVGNSESSAPPPPPSAQDQQTDANDSYHGVDLGVDDQLLVDSLRSIISGEPQSQSQLEQSNTDRDTVQALQAALLNADTTGRTSEEGRDRMRADARERKRRWRDSNVERNRMNDLRARIHRKAGELFGEGDSPQKTHWINQEFMRRRDRRDNSPNLYGTPPLVDRRSLTRQQLEVAQEEISRLFRESNAALEPRLNGLRRENPDTMPYLPELLTRTPNRPKFTINYSARTPKSKIKVYSNSIGVSGVPPRLPEIIAEQKSPVSSPQAE